VGHTSLHHLSGKYHSLRQPCVLRKIAQRSRAYMFLIAATFWLGAASIRKYYQLTHPPTAACATVATPV